MYKQNSILEGLLARSRRLIDLVSDGFKRDLLDHIQWDWRLISIVGARGVGKTTLLLQHAKQTDYRKGETVYVSLDDLYFTEHRLVEFAEDFYQQGGKLLLLDEVHKYPGWAREIKNLYDFLPDLKIVFSGSSIIELLKQEVDLSRRVISYQLYGLSFREYLKVSGIYDHPRITLDTLLENHIALSTEISRHIRPLAHLEDYWQYGYYPFFLEGKAFYTQRLLQSVQLVIEGDISFIPGYDPRNARKVQQLFYILATNVPFKPNISKLSEKMGIHRNTLVQYLHHLERAVLIRALYPQGISISTLQKPEKIFLNNTNLAYAIAPEQVNKGSLRETFFLSQLQAEEEIKLPKQGDFMVNSRYIFEVGGSGKTPAQIKDLENAFVVSDGIEIGHANRIPLWLFGFLY